MIVFLFIALSSYHKLEKHVGHFHVVAEMIHRSVTIKWLSTQGKRFCKEANSGVEMKNKRARKSRGRASSTRKTRPPQRDPLPFGHGGPCRLLVHCQACPLLPQSPADQLQHKIIHLRDQISRVDELKHCTIQVDPQSSPTKGYRFTAKPSVRQNSKTPGLSIGLYQPGTHELVDLKQC